ncbi:MAG: hypothetical protein OXF79_01645 [Chloroflexi bacterium]|nr:hypothetical protein [Chloroflexota bacterium]
MTKTDQYTGERLATRAERSIRSVVVCETLAGLMAIRGALEPIRSDDGPEFTAGSAGIGRWDWSHNPVHRAAADAGKPLRGEIQRQVVR